MFFLVLGSLYSSRLCFNVFFGSGFLVQYLKSISLSSQDLVQSRVEHLPLVIGSRGGLIGSHSLGLGFGVQGLGLRVYGLGLG